MPISTTRCYCDEFCRRSYNSDCCPDYDKVCHGKVVFPPPMPILGCTHNYKYYAVGQRIRDGCQECTCKAFSWHNATMECINICHNPVPTHPVTVIVKNDVAERINGGNYGWNAFNYPFLVGRTIGDVFRTRTGVCRSGATTFNYTLPIDLWPLNYNTEEFDARQKWPGMIQPISDQFEYPSSWAFSTVELISDRLAIRSGGYEKKTFSAQNLISCVYQLSQCSSIEYAWRHIRNYGIAINQCYPLTSKTVNGKGHCHVPVGEKIQTVRCPSGKYDGLSYRMPWHYIVRANETDIRREIIANGPVQAHLKVKEDFFFYRSGIYRHTYESQYTNGATHYIVVRIIGWGIDHSSGVSRKYWLCTNSWGTHWGENGYFRIIRGENESDIESYVYGFWPKEQEVP